MLPLQPLRLTRKRKEDQLAWGKAPPFESQECIPKTRTLMRVPLAGLYPFLEVPVNDLRDRERTPVQDGPKYGDAGRVETLFGHSRGFAARGI